MTKQEAIDAMLNGSKVTHPYFQEDEYIFMESGKVFYENGAEAHSFWEIRDHHGWMINWTIYQEAAEIAQAVELIGGRILTATDLEAMNAAEIKSRKIPLT